MSKEEFLIKLREALNGEIPEYEIENHISYYIDYLSNVSDGKSVEDKLNELGDPRLIARTIIDTAAVTTDPLERKGKGTSYSDESSYSDSQNMHDDYANTGDNYHFHMFSWNDLAWYQKILFAVIAILIVVAIIGIVVVGVNLFFSIILPVLIVLFLVRFIISLTRR